MSQPSETPPPRRRPWTAPRLTKVGTIGDVAGANPPVNKQTVAAKS